MTRASAWWNRARSLDPRLLDAWLVAALAAGAGWDWYFSHDPLWRLPLQLLIAASVGVRRRWPIVAFVAAAVAATALRVSPGLEGNIALAIDAYAIGRYFRHRFEGLAVVMACSLVVVALLRADVWPQLLVVFVAWLAGDSLRQRLTLEEALRREQSAGNRGAQEERARIARDLHDIVAHAVSVIAVQAEAAKNLIHRDPVRAEQAVDAVSANAREALGELRQLLEVLGGAGAPAPLTPSPTAADIAALVDRVRASGQPIELHVEGGLDSLAPAVSQAAYRIIQEGLTNAVRYARGARTEVRLGHRRDRLDVEVVDHGGPRSQAQHGGAGRGLAGLRERVAVFGGTLTTGPTNEGGFAVTASLPTAER